MTEENNGHSEETSIVAVSKNDSRLTIDKRGKAHFNNFNDFADIFTEFEREKQANITLTIGLGGNRNWLRMKTEIYIAYANSGLKGRSVFAKLCRDNGISTDKIEELWSDFMYVEYNDFKTWLTDRWVGENIQKKKDVKEGEFVI